MAAAGWALLRQMTVEERAGHARARRQHGQLHQEIPGCRDRQGQCRRDLVAVQPRKSTGCSACGPSPLKTPILFGLDVIHGLKTTFPIPLGDGLVVGSSVWKKRFSRRPRKTEAAGIRWTFTPMVNITAMRGGAVSRRAQGEDPYLGSAMARAQVRGSGAELGPDSVATTVEHRRIWRGGGRTRLQFGGFVRIRTAQRVPQAVQGGG